MIGHILQGYIGRQALYSCLTCVQGEDEAAGVCLACSLECHDGHELVELYTKRWNTYFTRTWRNTWLNWVLTCTNSCCRDRFVCNTCTAASANLAALRFLFFKRVFDLSFQAFQMRLWKFQVWGEEMQVDSSNRNIGILILPRPMFSFYHVFRIGHRRMKTTCTIRISKDCTAPARGRTQILRTTLARQRKILYYRIIF